MDKTKTKYNTKKVTDWNKVKNALRAELGFHEFLAGELAQVYHDYRDGQFDKPDVIKKWTVILKRNMKKESTQMKKSELRQMIREEIQVLSENDKQYYIDVLVKIFKELDKKHTGDIENSTKITAAFEKKIQKDVSALMKKFKLKAGRDDIIVNYTDYKVEPTPKRMKETATDLAFAIQHFNK